jgi:hypothetical protein
MTGLPKVSITDLNLNWNLAMSPLPSPLESNQSLTSDKARFSGYLCLTVPSNLY